MAIGQEKDCPMVIRAVSEMQASGPMMDLSVAVRFQRSPATVGPGAGDCAEVGAVGGNEWLLQAAIPSASIRTIAVGGRLVNCRFLLGRVAQVDDRILEELRGARATIVEPTKSCRARVPELSEREKRPLATTTRFRWNAKSWAAASCQAPFYGCQWSMAPAIGSGGFAACWRV